MYHVMYLLRRANHQWIGVVDADIVPLLGLVFVLVVALLFLLLLVACFCLVCCAPFKILCLT